MNLTQPVWNLQFGAALDLIASRRTVTQVSLPRRQVTPLSASSGRDHSGRVAKRMSLPGRAPLRLFCRIFWFLLEARRFMVAVRISFSEHWACHSALDRTSSCTTSLYFFDAGFVIEWMSPVSRGYRALDTAHTAPNFGPRKTFLSINAEICCLRARAIAWTRLARNELSRSRYANFR